MRVERQGQDSLVLGISPAREYKRELAQEETMRENDCAYPGCTGFSLSQCSDCGRRYCMRHKELVARYCVVCQHSLRQKAPKYMGTGVVLIALPVVVYFLLADGLRVRALTSAAITVEEVAFVAGLLGFSLVGFILFFYGFLNRR